VYVALKRDTYKVWRGKELETVTTTRTSQDTYCYFCGKKMVDHRYWTNPDKSTLCVCPGMVVLEHYSSYDREEYLQERGKLNMDPPLSGKAQAVDPNLIDDTMVEIASIERAKL
jgi:hypothetical protein